MALVQIIINRPLFRQLMPLWIGALIGVSFGTMLGWPSIAFPLLLDKDDSPILITLDQSSMIAGFLMQGNIIGTLFSTVTIFGSKTGLLCSCSCQLAGWIVMYFAQNILGIGISRYLLGIGHGFGLGQLRAYAQETCEPQVSQKFMQYLPLSINVGVVLVYFIGTFLDFRVLSIVCGTIPLLQFVMIAAIPKLVHVPKNEIEEKPEKAIDTVSQNKDLSKVEDGNKTSSPATNTEQADMGFIDVFMNKDTRMVFILLCFLIFIPQYSGGAANIVYSQIVHIVAINPYPQVCSVMYSVVFLISNVVAFKYVNKLPRRPVLLGSCLACSFILALVACYFYFIREILKISTLFVWSPLFLLSLFNFFHSTGVNIIPIMIINDRLPKAAKIVASKFYLMHFSLSAVLSTKIFQVLFTFFGMHMPYVFLSSVALGSAVIGFFVLKESSSQNKSSKVFEYHNEVDITDEGIYNRRASTLDKRPENKSTTGQNGVVPHVDGFGSNVTVLRDENIVSRF